MTNCAVCITDRETCHECNQGFFLNDSSCVLCSVTLEHCEVCSDENTCTECIEDYHTDNNMCIIDCHAVDCTACITDTFTC